MNVTYQIAIGAGYDAGNRHAKANGRTEWAEEDYNIASLVTNELLILAGWKIADDAGGRKP